MNPHSDCSGSVPFAELIDQTRQAMDQAQSIVIYGVGNIFPKVWSFVHETGNAAKVSAILDDQPGKGRMTRGTLRVQPPTRSVLENADIIVFTFPTYEGCLRRLGLDPGRPGIVRGDLLDYALTLSRRELNTISWIITSACNSRCNICGYWRSPQVHLDIDRVADTINAYPRTNHYIAGGETYCHPQWQTLFQRIRVKDDILVLTNGLLPEQIWKSCDQHGIVKFSVSLDGGPRAYQRIRGVDGYDRVVRTLRGLVKRPGTTVIVAIVIGPFTELEDFEHVEALCRELGLYLAPIIYREWQQFEGLPTAEIMLKKLPQFSELLHRSPVVSDLDRRFCDTYVAWYHGRLRAPCTSGYTKVCINERGQVTWCTDKLDPQHHLGNLYEASLPDIMASERFNKIAAELRDCNDCWNRSFRRFDVSCHWDRIAARLGNDNPPPQTGPAKPSPTPSTA